MLEILYRKMKDSFLNQTFVPGEGSPDATVMLIGEAPGKNEVEQQRPFVGAAGKNLDKFLQYLHLLREEIFITNAIKFRPVKQSPQGGFSNRTPTNNEIMAQRNYLMTEISIVNPRIIVTLGNVPLRSVMNELTASIGMCHGQPVRLPGTDYTVFPLYHPASIIYNKDLAAVYEEDLKKLAEFVTITVCK